MRRLAIRLFGGFELRGRGGSVVNLPTRKAQALVGYLAAHSGTAQPRDKLTALLWSESSERQARQSLRQALYSIRRALAAAGVHGEVLDEADGVALSPRGVEIDVLAFRRLARAGTPAALTRAVELFRGDLLEGLVLASPPFEEWLVAERERLRDLAQDALAGLVAHHERAGAVVTAVRLAVRLVSLDPLQEVGHRTLMRLYDRAGRRGAALRQYRLCAEVLAREVGAEPEAETRALYEALLARGGSAGTSGGGRAPALGAVAPLVGRERELAQLEAALAEARHGRGRLLLLVGESGIGKTRLAAQLAADASAAGVHALVGRAHELERVLPLSPWIEGLRSAGPAAARAVGELPPAWRAHLVRLMPEAGGAPALRHADDTLATQLEAVVQLLGRLAAAAPVVLVLEDMQWADETSIRLLALLGHRCVEWPLLVVATAREEELVEAPMLAGLVRGAGLAEPSGVLALGLLGRPATAALVRALAPAAVRGSTLARLTQRIWRHSAGHPFVATELMRAWLDAPRARRARTLELPSRVRDAIAARLERLPERSRAVLDAAAVVGREADPVLLARVAGLDPRAAADALDDLLGRRLLAATGEGFAFTHDRVRRVAYERLSVPRRRLLHAAAGEALEAAGAETAAGWDQLAHHFERAASPERAIHYLRRFAESAQRGYALPTALRALDAALARADALPHPERARAKVEMLLQKSQALSILGRFDDVFAALLPHRGAVDALGDSRLAGAFHVRIALTFVNLGRFREALEAATAALAHAERGGDDRTRGLTHYVLAIHGFSAGDPRGGEAHGRRAAELLEGAEAAQHAGWAQWAGQAHWIRALNQHLLGDVAGALASAARAAAIAEASGDAGLAGSAAWAEAGIELSRGRVAHALRAAERALAASASHPSNRATALGLLGRARLDAGDAAGAVAALEESVEALGPFEIRQSLFAGFLAEARAARGELAAARAAATRALEVGARAGCPWVVAAARRALGRVLVAGGEPAAAATALREAMAAFEAVPALLEAARARLELAAALHGAGEPGAAVTELAAARRQLAELDGSGYLERADALAREWGDELLRAR